MVLHELLRQEGLGGLTTHSCPRCPRGVKTVPTFRCRDCSPNVLLCRKCCIEQHQIAPFHRVDVSSLASRRRRTSLRFWQSWNGVYFEEITLRDLGVVIQLGHQPGQPCRAPYRAPQMFLVIHTNGFHPVTIQFCQCGQLQDSGTRIQQLLRYKLFPATTTDPSTCCTFAVLKQFHLLTLQSKVSLYDFYASLEKLTDNTGVGVRCVSVRSIHVMSII